MLQNKVNSTFENHYSPVIVQKLPKNIYTNSEILLIENKFSDVLSDTTWSVCEYENVNVTMIRCSFNNISYTQRSPCMHTMKSSVFMFGNTFTSCMRKNGGDNVYCNCYAHYSSPNISMLCNSIDRCSPKFQTGSDSSIYIEGSKVYWRCHNASNNGGNRGGSLSCITNSNDADIKYMKVINPLDYCSFVTHASNTISNLIIINAYMASNCVFWINDWLNIFDSLILNCKSLTLYQGSTNIKYNNSFVESDFGNIGTNFTTNFAECNLIYYKHNIHNRIEVPSCESEYSYSIAAMVAVVIL